MKDTHATQEQLNAAKKLGRLQLQRELTAQGIALELSHAGDDLMIVGWHNPEISTDRAIIDLLGLYFHLDVKYHAIPSYGGRGWLWNSYDRRLILTGPLKDIMLARISDYSHARLLQILQDENMRDEISGLYNADGTRNYDYYIWHELYADDPLKNTGMYGRVDSIHIDDSIDPATGESRDLLTYSIEVVEIQNMALSGATDFEDWTGIDHDKPYLVTRSIVEIDNTVTPDLRCIDNNGDEEDLIIDPWYQAEEKHRYGLGQDQGGWYATLADAMRASDIPADMVSAADYAAPCPPYGDTCGQPLADGSICEMELYPPTPHAAHHLDISISAWRSGLEMVAPDEKADRAPHIAYELLQSYARIWLELSESEKLPFTLNSDREPYVMVNSYITGTTTAIKLLREKAQHWHDYDLQEQVIKPLYDDILARLLA